MDDILKTTSVCALPFVQSVTGSTHAKKFLLAHCWRYTKSRSKDGGSMARKVFFSFHYKRDVRRVSQVRNSWIIRPGGEAQPFLDKAEWESIKRTGSAAIEKWIDTQLSGTSVTVVLIGAETSERPWVRHEIKRSYELKKGMLGIYLNNIKDPLTGTDTRGKNPFDYWNITVDNNRVPMSKLYPTYDWVQNDGYKNLSAWIEQAALAAGRR
jgi:hypothetical protein